MGNFISSLKSLIDSSNLLFEARHPSGSFIDHKSNILLSYNDDETIAYLTFGQKSDLFAFLFFIQAFLYGSSFSVSGNVLTIYFYHKYDPNKIIVV